MYQLKIDLIDDYDLVYFNDIGKLCAFLREMHIGFPNIEITLKYRPRMF